MPQGLQNEAPEPPEFSPNLDLDAFECQVAPQEASEAPPQARFGPKIVKKSSKNVQNICSFIWQSETNLLAKIWWDCTLHLLGAPFAKQWCQRFPLAFITTIGTQNCAFIS